MQLYFIMKKINIFIIYISLTTFPNFCFAMEDPATKNDRESQIAPKKEIYSIEEKILKFSTNILVTQEITSPWNTPSWEDEYDAYLKARNIYSEHEKLNIDISTIQDYTKEIDFKIKMLKHLESLLLNQHANPQTKETVEKKKRTKHKKLTFKSIRRQAKKVRDNRFLSTEQKLNHIRKLLDKEHTLNLSQKKRAKLCYMIKEIPITQNAVNEYILSLDKKIQETKEQLKQNSINIKHLKLIRQAYKKGTPISPRETSKTNIPIQKIKRANSSPDLLKCKKE